MNVMLNITQYFTCNKCSKIIERWHNLTNITDTITLLNGYVLSILTYNTNYVIIKLEYENNVYIRILYTTYPFEMCFNIQNNNCSYKIKIVTNIL